LTIEEIRDKFASGEERGIEEVLLWQLLSNPQQDSSSIWPLFFLMAERRRHSGSRMGLFFALMMAQQQQAMATAAATGGAPLTAPQPNNMLPILAALMLEEREPRDVIVRPFKKKSGPVEEYVEEDVEEKVTRKSHVG
jgi:hypothetical protein